MAHEPWQESFEPLLDYEILNLYTGDSIILCPCLTYRDLEHSCLTETL